MGDPTDYAPRTRRWVRPLVFGGLALVVLWAAGLAYLFLWKSARAGQPSDSLDYSGVRQVFLEAIDAGRFDDAYLQTAGEYQGRVSRAEFEGRARKYRDFKARPDVRGVSGETSGPAGGDARGPNSVITSYTLEDADGNRLKVTTRVVFRDSLLHRNPPPPRVEDFTVLEEPPATPRKP